MEVEDKNFNKLDELPRREPMKGKKGDCEYYYNRSDFPWVRFNRFLISCVGKHIDDIIHEFVNAEWCPAQYRTASKITEYIEIHTFTEGKEIFFYSSRSVKPENVKNGNRYRNNPFLYVHPVTKILCANKIKYNNNYAAEREKELKNTVHILGDFHQYLKLEGIWYEVKAKVVNFSFRYAQAKDILIGKQTYDSGSRWDKKLPIEITLKRQLSSSELKKNGLKNDDAPTNKKCAICGGIKCIHSYNS